MEAIIEKDQLKSILDVKAADRSVDSFIEMAGDKVADVISAGAFIREQNAEGCKNSSKELSSDKSIANAMIFGNGISRQHSVYDINFFGSNIKETFHALKGLFHK